MEPLDPGGHHLLDHLHGHLNSEGLDGLVVLLDRFQFGFEFRGHNRLAELRHPLETAVVLNREQSGQDGDVDSVCAALVVPADVHVRVVEELGDNVVASGLDFVNQVLVVLFLARVVNVAFRVPSNSDARNEC